VLELERQCALEHSRNRFLEREQLRHASRL
jgi:hypothetical protein